MSVWIRKRHPERRQATRVHACAPCVARILGHKFVLLPRGGWQKMQSACRPRCGGAQMRVSWGNARDLFLKRRRPASCPLCERKSCEFGAYLAALRRVTRDALVARLDGGHALAHALDDGAGLPARRVPVSRTRGARAQLGACVRAGGRACVPRGRGCWGRDPPDRTPRACRCPCGTARSSAP